MDYNISAIGSLKGDQEMDFYEDDLPIEKENENPNDEADEIRHCISNGLIDHALKLIKAMHVSDDDRIRFARVLLTESQSHPYPNQDELEQRLSAEFKVEIPRGFNAR